MPATKISRSGPKQAARDGSKQQAYQHESNASRRDSGSIFRNLSFRRKTPEKALASVPQVHEQREFLRERVQKLCESPKAWRVFEEILDSAERFDNRSGTFGKPYETKRLVRELASFLERSPGFEDIWLIQEGFEYLKGSQESFEIFLKQLSELSQSSSYQDLRIPFRASLRSGLSRNQSPIAITKAFHRLSERPGLLAGERKESTFQFIRGLIRNDWHIAPAIEELLDAFRNYPSNAALKLAAESAIFLRPGRTDPLSPNPHTKTPPLSALMMNSSLEEDEIRIAQQIMIHYHRNNLPIGDIFFKVSILCEACKCATKSDSLRYVLERIEHHCGPEQHEALDVAVDYLYDNISHSLDNRGIQRLVTQLQQSQDPKKAESLLGMLRGTYCADVLPEVTPVSSSTKPMFERQSEIFNEVLSAHRAFADFQAFMGTLRDDFRSYPGSHSDASLISRFGFEMGKVAYLKTQDTSAPGVVISDLTLERLFDLDWEHPRDPLHKYHQAWKGWLGNGIEDLVGSELIVSDTAFAFSPRDSSRFRLHGFPYSIVYFHPEQSNFGENVCFLVPTEVIDEIVSKAKYDFLDGEMGAAQARDLSSLGFTPDGLFTAAVAKGLPLVDLGCGSTVGGFSNGYNVRYSKELSWVREIDTGIDTTVSFDLWRQPKKTNYLQEQVKIAGREGSELFRNHDALHSHINDLARNFSVMGALFQERYGSWKRGKTPDNTMGGYDDRWSWIEDIPRDFIKLRMLCESYKRRQFFLANNTPLEEWPELRFMRVGQMELGPFPNRKISLQKMEIQFDGFSLPLPTPAGGPFDTDIRKLSLQPHILRDWMVYVESQLEGCIPVFLPPEQQGDKHA